MYWDATMVTNYTTFLDVKLHGLVGNANVLEKSKYYGSNYLW